MKSLRNWLIGLVLVGLAAGGGWWWWTQRQAAQAAAKAAAIRQETVTRGDIFATVSATGNLAPQAQINLYFSTAAPLPVTAVNVVLGQAVKEGEVLAALDTTDLQLAVTQAEQAVQAAQLNLDLLNAPPRPEDIAVAEASVRVANNRVYQASQGQSADTVEIARLNLLLAQNALNQTYNRMDALAEQGKWAEKNALQAQANQQVDQAKIADLRYQAAQQPGNYGPVASALASVEQAQAALDKLKAGPSAEDRQIAQLQVKQAQAALELAQHNLEGAQILAPFAGVVAAVNVRAGEPASGALPALVLADVSQFYLDVAVDEVDVARVTVGQPVSVTLDALPEALVSARVTKIAPTATTSQGVVSYQVRLVLDPTEALLRGGLTATGTIIVAEAHAVVLVPNWAILRDKQSGATFVGILKNGTITDVPVMLGLRDETFSEIISGVNAGDVVAVDTTREQLFSLFGGGD